MLTRWSPMTELSRIFHDMDRLLSEAMSDNGVGSWTINRVLSPPINLYDTGDHLVLVAAIPGITTDDLEISAEQNVVTISGKIALPLQDDEEAERVTWYRRELGLGHQFQRRVTLPVAIEASDAEAHYENGILRLTLPKVAKARLQRIPVRTAQSLTSSVN